MRNIEQEKSIEDEEKTLDQEAKKILEQFKDIPDVGNMMGVSQDWLKKRKTNIMKKDIYKIVS